MLLDAWKWKINVKRFHIISLAKNKQIKKCENSTHIFFLLLCLLIKYPIEKLIHFENISHLLHAISTLRFQLFMQINNSWCKLLLLLLLLGFFIFNLLLSYFEYSGHLRSYENREKNSSTPAERNTIEWKEKQWNTKLFRCDATRKSNREQRTKHLEQKNERERNKGLRYWKKMCFDLLFFHSYRYI